MTEEQIKMLKESMNDFDVELKKTSAEEVEEIMNKTQSLGDPDDMSDGQILNIPVASDGQGNYVFFGPLDYTGNSNDLSDEELKEFTKKITDFDAEYFTKVKKTSDDSKMWIFARASSSIGACDMIALYPSLKDILVFLKEVGEFDEDDLEDVDLESIESMKEFVAEYFQHSFFTGLVFGPFEYVSGPKPNENGFAEV